MRIAPLMPAAWLALVAFPAAAQPAEAPASSSGAAQVPTGLAPSIRIRDGDTSIDIQCSVRDTIGECTDAAVRIIDRLNGAGGNEETGAQGANDISG